MNHVTSKVEPDIDGVTEGRPRSESASGGAGFRHPVPEAARQPAAGVHLLAADERLDECRHYGDGAYMALCGALVPAAGLPSSLCPPGCRCSVYCPECMRRVAEIAESADCAGAAR